MPVPQKLFTKAACAARTTTVPLVIAALLLGVAIAPARAESTLFNNVSVVDVVAREVHENDVLVRDGRVVAIGRSLPVPERTRVVEEAGFLMPGLGEMHAHIPPQSSPEVARYLTLYLSQGITVIRGMLGEPGHLDLREQAAKGELFSPRIVTTGPSFNGRSVTSPSQATMMVKEQKAAGYDMLKIHPGLTAEEIVAVARAAREHNIPFVGHVTYAAGLKRVLELGQSTIDHMDDYVRAMVPPDDPRLDDEQVFFGINLAPNASLDRAEVVTGWTKDAGAWVVPTESLMVNYAGLSSLEALESLPGLAYVSQRQRNRWRRARLNFTRSSGYDEEAIRRFLSVRKSLLKRLNDGAANILLGSDAPQIFNVPGYSIHQELELYVDAGLTPWEALSTGTTNVARYLADTERGNVAPGMIADLVLLASDPTKDISATRDILGVMIAGRWHDRRELDRRLSALLD